MQWKFGANPTLPAQLSKSGTLSLFEKTILRRAEKESL
jgi:hypothetical protein